MDAETSAAIAAIVIASLAFFIALAQVLQQYFQTGQSIRLCDSVVYGPLPGKGKRVWQRDQWRFRVIYSIPQICLDPSLWPNGMRHVSSYALGEHPLPSLRDTTDDPIPVDGSEADVVVTSVHRRRSWKSELTSSGSSSAKAKSPPPPAPNDPHTGEAAWTSFIRAVEPFCGESVRFDVVTGDADRVPSDLNTVPMLVSVREIIMMGLMAEMEVSSFSFEKRSLAMQGRIGSITSSHHSTLGPVLHFAPRPLKDDVHSEESLVPSTWRGSISGWWLLRTWDNLSVARKCFNSLQRRTVRRLDRRWRRDNLMNAEYSVFYSADDDYAPGPRPRRGKEPENAGKEDVDGEGTRAAPSNTKEMKETIEKESERSRRFLGSTTVRMHEHDGSWFMYPSRRSVPRSKPGEKSGEKEGENVGATKSGDAQDKTEPTPVPNVDRRATVEDASDQEGDVLMPPMQPIQPNPPIPPIQPVGTLPAAVQIIKPDNESEAGSAIADERRAAAQARQAVRNEAYRRQNADEEIATKMEEQGIPLPSKPGQLLLTYHPLSSSDDKPSNATAADEPEPVAEPTEEEKEARDRHEDRKRTRQEKERARKERNRERAVAIGLRDACPFWWCQIDTLDGPWATPWKTNLSMPTEDALVGGIMVILEALLGYLSADALQYINPYSWEGDVFREAVNFLTVQGRSSWPPYAINARRGVIADGAMEETPVAAFADALPVLQLLWSYKWQVAGDLRDRGRGSDLRLLNAEIVRIDAWLSYVGRLPEIVYGKGQLLDNTPALVQLLSEEFEPDFINLDQSAEEGGYQDIQALVENVLDFLVEDENLSEPEQLYLLVALLRTYKVCQCIAMGQDTKPLEEVVLRDIQAYLV